jgi:hypothetical protein
LAAVLTGGNEEELAREREREREREKREGGKRVENRVV